MVYGVKKFNEKLLDKKFSSYVIGVDIGGTNTNIGVAGVEKTKPNLLFSLNFKSKKIDSVIPAIKTTISYAKNNYGIKINFACIGAAGVISPNNDSARLTNVKWNVNKKDLIEKTSLNSAYIINDFQSIGYGLNLLDHDNRDDFYPVRTGKIDIKPSKSTKVIIGAGTGLGKSILTHDKHYNTYIPLSSEGGHADLPIQSNLERELVEFIKKLRKISYPLSYEEVLSGRGIESIYLFFRNTKKIEETKYTKKIDDADEKASLISKYKDIDRTCKETFQIFARFYARCAKNYVLDTFASGGLYIAGGIAAKNKELFNKKEFFEEFEKSDKRKDFLKKIPIYIITNYNISLYGSCFAAALKISKNNK